MGKMTPIFRLFLSLSEHNDKQIDGQVEFKPPTSDNVGNVSCQTKLAEAGASTCLPEVIRLYFSSQTKSL